MTEKELGKDLLDLDHAKSVPPMTSRELAETVLNRDRWRIRVWTCLASLFWILTTAGLLALCYVYLTSLSPRLETYQSHPNGFERDANSWLVIGQWAIYLLAGCFLSLLLAAGCTLGLIFHTRRATLRHINHHLAEISEQLRQLGKLSSSNPPSSQESS